MTYIVIDAAGYCGTYFRVYARCVSLDGAIREARRHEGLVVSDDGGYAENHQVGDLIHSQFRSAYTTHWSPRLEAAEAARRASEGAFDRAEHQASRRYGRGSGQYLAAMDDYMITGRS